MKKIFAVLAAVMMIAMGAASYAAQNAGGILKEGLLGAGAGVAGGAVSGAKSKNLWKGALVGAGVNIVGGAVLDSITGEQVRTVESIPAENAYSTGYNDGFNNGFKQGYTQGFKDGIKEDASSE